MAKRQVIEVPGLRKHGDNPIPNLVRVGNMVFSAAIGGSDPETQEVPESPAEQTANAFANIKRAVETAGGSADDIAKVTVFVRDRAVREHVNAEWVKLFPDEASRPVRHMDKGR